MNFSKMTNKRISNSTFANYSCCTEPKHKKDTLEASNGFHQTNLLFCEIQDNYTVKWIKEL